MIFFVNFAVIYDSVAGAAAGIKKLTERSLPRLARGLGLVAAYAAWVTVFRLLCLTLITYSVISSGGDRSSRFEEINEAYGAVEFVVIGLGSVLFLLLLRLVHPDP